MKEESRLEKLKEQTNNKVKINGLYNFENDDADVKVSIIIPIYNVEKYLEECLDSAINQTLKEIEIICVNDGSTDGSLEILKQYASNDKRVKIIDKDNAGYGHTMNIGIDMARGEYIGIIESDDFVKNTMMEELYCLAKENNLDIVKGDFYRFVNENGNNRVFYTKLSEKNAVYNRVINLKMENELCLFSNTWSGIYRKNFLYDYGIRHNETPGASYQDNGFWFLTTLYANSIMYVDKAFYYNRRDNENSSVYSKGKVFTINNEYKYIYDFVTAEGTEYEGAYDWMFQKKFDAYIFNYRRIDKAFKKEFILYLSREFSNDLTNSPMSYQRLSVQKRHDVEEIINSPISYYERTKNDENYSYIAEEDTLNNVVNIVFICDSGYVVPTAVAIKSLLLSKDNDSIYNIIVVSRGLSDEQIRYLNFKKQGVSESFILIDDHANKREITPYGVSDSALLKFKLSSLLPKLSKVLYIDGDVIIKKDLRDLYMTELGRNYAGVVRDIPQTLYENQIFGIEFGTDYFNSGVMLLNLEQIRKDNCENKLIQERNKSKSRLMDQDIYNKVFKEKVVQMPIKYNTLYVNLIRSKGKYQIGKINDLYGTKYTSIEDIRKDSAIIHYCSSDKPWKYYDTPMADEWIYIYSLFNDNEHRIVRSSLYDVSNKLPKCNSVINIDRSKEQIAVTFFLRRDNYDEIATNIQTITALNISADFIILYDNGLFIDKSYFNNKEIIYINISKLIAKDTEYLSDPQQQLPNNYYRMILPELLFDYGHIVVIDGAYLKDNNLYEIVQSVEIEEICAAWVRTEKLVTFWESPFMIIDAKKFVMENVKGTFWKIYNGNYRPGGSISKAINKYSIYLGSHIINIPKVSKDISDDLIDIINKTNNTNKELIRKLEFKEKEIRRLEYELLSTRTSFSCRLGLFLTALPRKIFKRG